MNCMSFSSYKTSVAIRYYLSYFMWDNATMGQRVGKELAERWQRGCRFRYSISVDVEANIKMIHMQKRCGISFNVLKISEVGGEMSHCRIQHS